MEVKAHLRYLRIAPRKVRLVTNLIAGMPVDQAIDQLSILPKRSAHPVLKLLNSAIANAEHNFKLERASLKVKSAVANEGPKLKRYRPRAFGRAAEILKRMSHVTIVLEGKAPAKAAPKKTEAAPDKVTAAEVKHAPAKPKKTAPKKAAAPKATTKNKEQQRAATDAEVSRKGES